MPSKSAGKEGKKPTLTIGVRILHFWKINYWIFQYIRFAITVIEEGNWLTLQDDIADIKEVPEEGFDAVICLGNSFAHLPDITGEWSAKNLQFE